MDQQPSVSREVSVFLVSMASDLSATIYVSRLSAAVREPVIWYVSFPHGEPSVRCPVPVAGGGDASVSMEPYRWSLKV